MKVELQCAVERQVESGNRGPHKQGEQPPDLPGRVYTCSSCVNIHSAPFILKSVPIWMLDYMVTLTIRHVKQSGFDPEGTGKPLKSFGFYFKKNTVENGLGILCLCDGKYRHQLERYCSDQDRRNDGRGQGMESNRWFDIEGSFWKAWYLMCKMKDEESRWHSDLDWAAAWAKCRRWRQGGRK